MPIILKAYQEISNKKAIANAVSNAVSYLLADTAGDRLANDYVLTLTDEELQMELVGYSEWGAVPEVRETKSVKRDKIRKARLEDENKIVIETEDEPEELVFYYKEPQREFAQQLCLELANE
ncbi:hypothetical protein [Anaerostipes sp.]|uniref:hypothetical protein n=1 Tax=Anaerostipes sp. TaxID=1872530 RepID=UPI0025BE637C|nr:hypothetical protein [Anaerostipes sp.]MBS7009902.1 hypothetical protein [Anaerostipes sp.]